MRTGTFRRTLLLAGLLFCGLLGGSAEAADVLEAKSAEAEPPDNGPDFMRIVRDEEDKPLEFQTAIARYVPNDEANGKGEVEVDLVSVAHVGERSYYQELNERLANYDVVLYELVAAKGTRIPKNANSNALLPNMLKSVLKMEYQTEQIDYTQKHFVHADLSPEEIAKKMKERGQTGLSLFFDVYSEMMSMQRSRLKKAQETGEKIPQPDLLALLFDPKGELKFRRYMAEEMLHSQDGDSLGETLGTMLIADRNEAALLVLQDQLDDGKKRIAIFYGAAHMPDMHERLVDQFGLKLQATEWVSAWNLDDYASEEKPAKEPRSDDPEPVTEPAAVP